MSHYDGAICHPISKHQSDTEPIFDGAFYYRPETMTTNFQVSALKWPWYYPLSKGTFRLTRRD